MPATEKVNSDRQIPLSQELQSLVRASKEACSVIQGASSETKNAALRRIAERLNHKKAEILAANKIDVEAANKAVEEGRMTPALASRLNLEGAKFEKVVASVQAVEKLPDPIGRLQLATKLDQELYLYRVSSPLGVVCVVFEARPEVVIDIGTLAIKSGNAVILKGGKEAGQSLRALHAALQEGIDGILPKACVQMIYTRDDVAQVLKMDKYVDLLIARGGKELTSYVRANTHIPVIGHLDGICAAYVDEHADLEKTLNVVRDSKLSYMAACNALETILVHHSVIQSHLLPLVNHLAPHHVLFHCDRESYETLQQHSCLNITKATPEDFDTEWLEPHLSVKTVRNVEEAVSHVNKHGSHHTDTVLTESREVAKRFLQQVDSASVFWNASTRFADGYRFGLGAEIGISTNKTHARGPVGLEGLVSYKYVLHGSGQASDDYGPGKARQFLHEARDPADMEVMTRFQRLDYQG